MTDHPPDWVEELRESPADEEPSPAEIDLTAPPSGSGFSRAQLITLAGLGLLLCLICGGLGIITLLNRGQLFGAERSAVAAASEPIPASPTPLPTATATATATPSPTPTVTKEPTATATYAVAPAFTNKDKIDDIKNYVERWRELALPTDVPITFLTREELRIQWKEEAYDMAALEAVQAQQEFYMALGLIEPEVDLVEAALESETDLVMGYYTPEEQAIYIVAESVNMFANEEMTFAHEYVHAIQDYHFDLDTILNREGSSDAALAARSLPEGDARLIETIFIRDNIGEDQIEYSIYRYLFEEHPTLEGVSPALGILTFFPYTAGEYFVRYLLVEDQSWRLVNQAYFNPPVSTEQVMHPEKYLAGEQPIPVTVPDLGPVLGSNWSQIDQNVLGEAGFLVWLIDQVDEQLATTGAAGWDGDTYSLWTNETDQQRLLVESSIWESAGEATAFGEAFRSYMALRETEAVQTQTGRGYQWDYEGGLTSLSQTGRQVIIIIAPNQEVMDKVQPLLEK